MQAIQLLFLVSLLVLYQHVSVAENVQVTTPLGKILGTTLTSRLGKKIYTFRGIHYAKPPINELRFKPPVPAEPWSGVYNATLDGPVCPQVTTDPTVSEDCLVLNVYTTKLPPRGHHHYQRRPVIIYLHPVAFYGGSGSSTWFGPQYLMDQEIVLVSINYRVGTLGFLSIGKDSPGNNGLKDQVLAMKWVKYNIEAFGGDPNSVTLYGYSAGAWSITLHMVSPMSRGLFHKGILGSGAALGPWPLPRNQIDVAKRQARIVGCPDNNIQEVFNCLKTTPAKQLGDSLPQFAELGPLFGLVWSPVIEEDYGQERFLTDNPIKLFLEGNFYKVPVMAGVTEYEFAEAGYYLVSNATLLRELDQGFEKWAPILLNYEQNTPKSKEVTRNARKFYLGDKPLSNDSLTGLSELYADIVVGYPVYRAVNLIAAKNTKPTFYYELTYSGRYSYFYLPGTDKPLGAVHHDELIYTFYISALFPFFNSSFPEGEMVDTITSLWATFAKTGNPVANRKFSGVEWIPYTRSSQKYMDIGKPLVLKQNLLHDRYAFWERQFPIFSYP